MVDNDVVQDVFQLDLKFNGLVARGKRNGDSKLCSLRALDRSEVIAYSTLQSAMKAQHMSVGDQKALAAAMDFTPSGANGARWWASIEFLEKGLCGIAALMEGRGALWVRITPGDIMSERWARSSRNAWATSSESASKSG